MKSKKERNVKSKKTIIGTVTTYRGHEHRYLTGYKVRIVAILKNAAKPGIDQDPDYLTDDHCIGLVGGVTAHDRVEVQPWIEQEGRFSFVTSDPKATDLECFAGLANGKKGKNQ